MSETTGLTITPGEIKRTQPRTFVQVGKVEFGAGAKLTRAVDHMPITAATDFVGHASRYVRKSGKALGPWTFNYGSYAYVERAK